MKKLILMIAVSALFVTMAGCADTDVKTETNAGTETVGGVEDTSAEAPQELLEMIGMSQEEFAAMDPEKQQALLDELGMVMESQQKQEENKQEVKTYTPDDVMAGGSYKVVLGDYMNSITLYYEDGVLVKLEESFQKSSEEDAESYTVEGAALADYTFNFIDWANAPLQEILDGMKDYGGFGQYQIMAN